MMLILAVVSACLVIVLLGSCIFCLMMRKKARKGIGDFFAVSSSNSVFTIETIILFYSGEREIIISQQANISNFQYANFQGRYDPNAQESPHIDLASILAATNNFSDSNKLGQGGFGPVYKVI
jgi:hypothetical protein